MQPSDAFVGGFLLSFIIFTIVWGILGGNLIRGKGYEECKDLAYEIKLKRKKIQFDNSINIESETKELERLITRYNILKEPKWFWLSIKG